METPRKDCTQDKIARDMPPQNDRLCKKQLLIHNKTITIKQTKKHREYVSRSFVY